VVTGAAIFDLGGHKIYELKGINIYRLSSELVGHQTALKAPRTGWIASLTGCSPAEAGLAPECRRRSENDPD
jgi:hypothetical protein